MISESSYWKNDLLVRASSLEKRMNQKRWSESSFVRLEQNMMLGFYTIRKLIEAHKLSDAIANHVFELEFFKPTGRPVTWQNYHRIEELYDFNLSHKTKKNTLFICNQFIHSYVFIASFNEENRLDGVCFNSDKERNNALYYLNIQKVISLFRNAGNDYPTSIQATYNPKKKDYDVFSQTIDYKELVGKENHKSSN